MPDFLARSILSKLSPAGPRGKLSIFIFHRILSEMDPVLPDAGESTAEFDAMLSWIDRWFNVISLEQAVDALQAGQLPERAASITFDDGYADNYLNACPILQKHGMHATFFVATGFLDGGIMWNDKVIEGIRRARVPTIDARRIGLDRLSVVSRMDKQRAVAQLLPALKHRPPSERGELVEQLVDACRADLPADLMMTSEQVRGLHSEGMGIGAHTVTHPILASCDDDVARAEILESREFLEKLLNERISLFAYPNGRRNDDYLDRHVEMVRETGFKAAVSTNPGASGCHDDVFQLRRFTPWDKSRWRFWLRLARNLA